MNCEKVRELFKYEDGNLVWKEARGSVSVGTVAGCIYGGGYPGIQIDGKVYKVHRLVWLYFHGCFPENYIDHINRKRDDNRIENLREATNSCNIRNCGNFSHNTSGVKGVCYNKQTCKWNAYIKVAKKLYSLGSDFDFNEAVLLRLAAEQCLNWEKCDSASPAYRYAVKNKLICRANSR